MAAWPKNPCVRSRKAEEADEGVGCGPEGPPHRRRNCVRSVFTVVLMASGSTLFAQSPEVSIEMPKETPVLGRFLRPFHLEKRQVAPAKLTNTPRLESLVRSGNLYLSVQDVIALTLENNLDIAVQRYGPFLAREILRRTEGGGILRQVDTPVAPGPTSVSTAGISSNATGLGGGALTAGGGVITAIGPTPPSLDPSIFVQVQAGHSTTPQTNTVLVGTTSLTSSFRSFASGYNQTFITGTNVAFTFVNSRNYVNSSSPLFNPSLSGFFDLTFNQPLLQGFSPAVNNRDIRIARNNMKVSDLLVKLQVATTVSAALNLYWDLVSFNEAVRIKERALAVAQDLFEGNKKQVAIGALAGIEVTRAAAAVSVSKEDLLIAQTNVAQQEIVLKNALNRNGIDNAWLDDVHIIPLDQIEVPKTEEIRPIQDLIQEALANRLEISRDKINLQSQQLALKGDRNGILPSLSAFAEFTNHGLGGPANPLYVSRCAGSQDPIINCGPPNPYFLGGNTSVFAQLFGRAFPDYSAGFSFNIPLRNRAAQADYVTDQLQIRQAELQLQRAMNQVRVDVKTNVIGLQQARSRYETAVASRVLAEQTLDAEQKRFQAGVGSVALVIQAQQGLASTQDAEVQAMANYTHNKISFDLALGRALEVNHISMQEAISGHVGRESVIPANIPPARRPEVRK
ncbi:MAG: TolC family protein [Acidobacteriia bacterium]|nr:TolC family protein [Terriglobia bacterium]